MTGPRLISIPTIPLATGVSGILPVANGGTGQATIGAALIAFDAGRPTFRASAASQQNVAVSGTPEKIVFGTETYDTANNFANSRYTATIAGYHVLRATVRVDDTVAVTSMFASFYTGSGAGGASEYSRGVLNLAGAAVRSFSDEIFLAVGDFAEVWGAVSGTAPFFSYTSAVYTSFFSGVLVRAT